MMTIKIMIIRMNKFLFFSNKGTSVSSYPNQQLNMRKSKNNTRENKTR